MDKNIDVAGKFSGEAETSRDIWSAGQGTGNIHDILPADELCDQLVAEYYQYYQALTSCGAGSTIQETTT